MLCMAVVGAATAASAYLVKPAMDDIFLDRNEGMLILIPIAVIVIYLLKGLCNYGQTVLMSHIGFRVITDLRNDLYRHILRQPLSFFTKHPTGILISRVTNDVTYLQGAVSEAVTSLLKDSFTLVGLVVVIFWRDWKLAIIASLVFPLAVYPIAQFGRKMRRIATESQVSMGDLISLLQETITGNRIVKAFGMEEHENRRFAKENERQYKLTMKSVTVRAISSPLMEFLGGLGIAAIIFYGGWQVIAGTSTPGTFFSFLAALLMLYEPVKRLTNVNNTIQQGLAGAERIFQILDTEPAIQNGPGAAELPPIREEISIERVTFRYDEAPVLRDVSLKIRAGEVIAFVGMSGGGKTTLVNLIPRFYDVNEGRVAVDGTDIRTVTLESLRAQIGIVTQQTILFNDTVRGNIAYGDVRKSEADIIRAAQAANAHDFILKLPRGYDTVIGDQGIRLSGGDIIEAGVNGNVDPLLVRASLELWFSTIAKQKLTAMFAEMLEKHRSRGFNPSGFCVRKMKKRWGSCSSKGNIAVSYDLIRLDDVFSEYVIIHELCHLKHHNHSRDYYRLLSEVYPGWKSVRKELRTWLR